VEIRKIEDWHAPASIGAAYARMLHAAGGEALGPALHGALTAAVTGVRRIYLFETTERHASTLAYFRCEPELIPLLALYTDAYRGMDPLGHAYAAAPRPGDLALQRIRPDDIASSGFRRMFFDDRGIVERVSVIQRVAGGWRGVNLARHCSDGVLDAGELDAFVALAWLALPMLALGGVRRAPAPHIFELEQRFAGLCPSLSPRERQVCARAAIGMSIEASAIDLEVARTSVRTYRKRAYARLGVASPLELLALVAR